MDAPRFPHWLSPRRGIVVDIHSTKQAIDVQDADGVIHTVDFMAEGGELRGQTVHILEGLEDGGGPLTVVAPDVLVDVSDAAQVAGSSEHPAELTLLRRLRAPSPARLALTGALVTAAFDILVRQPHASDEEILEEAFRTRPMARAAEAYMGELSLVDADTRSLLPTLRSTLASFGPARLILEPSYVSPIVGLQGRADIIAVDVDRYRIIELKAGRAATGTSIRVDHAAQAAGYAALVRLAEGRSELIPEVWYVRDATTPFRPVRAWQASFRTLIEARNAIVMQDLALADRDTRPLRNLLASRPGLGGSSYDLMARTDLVGRLSTLDPVERHAVAAWLSFASADRQQTKTVGAAGRRAPSCLTGLVLDVESSDFDRMHLRFDMPQDPGDHTVRVGDPVILYPMTNGTADPYRGALYKGTVRGLRPGRLDVSFRNKYVERDDLLGKVWAVEHDMQDSTGRVFDAALRIFIDLDRSKRDVLLGRRTPLRGTDPVINEPGLTDEQRAVVSRACGADELFLIQGPPGTGKTSAVLRSIIAHLRKDPSERVVAVAFTNRAANEISEVLSRHGIEHVRHGSVEGTSGDVSIPRLAQQMSAHELARRIAAAPVVVATIQSVYTSPEIWQFGNFTTAVIDEASQVLEPPLLGIMARVRRSILIGDHCQLPAVVTLPPTMVEVDHPALASIGLTSLAMSSFERLLRCAEQRGDVSCTAMLTGQGRMHADVMAVASDAFYDGRLEVLRPEQRSAQPLPWHTFIPTRVAAIDIRGGAAQAKAEAACIVDLTVRLIRAGREAGHTPTVGIISPFRAQNTSILHLLPEDLRSEVTVDTVERFQGSERDVIIYGCAVSTEQELRGIVSETTVHGRVVDRKLNVALTRARDQFILVGNTEVLSRSASYERVLSLLPRVHQ